MDNQNQKCNRSKNLPSMPGVVSRWALWLRNVVAMLTLALSWAVPSPNAQAQSVGLYREIYLGIPGSTLLSFTNVFPPAPDLTEVATNLFENPSNYGDNYGDRYRGLLVPPVTGSYVFWVQGQSSAILYLSPDESPANKVTLGYNLQSALARSWYVFPSQQSTNIYLEAGRRYYVEALHKSGNGDDSFAVGWKLPDGSYEQPMPALHFRPYGRPAVSGPVIVEHPTNLTVLEQEAATFRVAVSNLDAVTYQWRRAGTNLPGSVGASLTFLNAANSDNGSSIYCVVSNAFGVATSSVVTLVVTPDTQAPALLFAANAGTNTVQVAFSEPVDAVTAQTASNYALDLGVTVLSAQMVAGSRTVVLTTSPLARGSNYVLTVNNVRDRAQVPNTVASNSQQSFVVLPKGIYRQIFADLPGSLLSDLTNSSVYPGSPVIAEVLTNEFATSAYATNNYGQRLRAAVIAPETGNYVFELAAHDSATLLLGTNALASSARVIASVTRNGDVTAGQYDIQTNQSSGPISLIAGQQYYIEVLMKSGISVQFPPDHLSVRWRLPDGAIEEPIPIVRLTPSGLFAPVITSQPASVSVAEGQSATFAVSVGNLDPMLYQWQQNGTNLPGATNRTLIRSAVTLAESNSTLRCVLANFLGTTNSVSAVLTVTPDTVRPTISSVVNNGTNRIVVTYSELVDGVTATNLANYTVPGVTLSVPVLGTNGLTVTFNTTPLIIGSNYTITISGVRDRAVTFNTILTNSQVSFTAVDFFLQDIGFPAAGSAVPVAGGVNMTAGNGDYFGTNDSFNFAYQQRRGDFDVKVRLAKLSFADTWAMASLMAREDLNPTSKYAAVCATPSIAGVFFQYRTNTGVMPSGGGSFPVNYPYTWLRLERVGGSTFNGYASIDGETWTKLSSVTLAMPASIYLGFAMSSRSTTNVASAQFRDFTDNTNAVASLPPTSVEPLGPSSRRTGLVFSEIMYNPAPRTDGRKVEFVELYNSNPFFEDISGYRIAGDLSYTFPQGTVIPGGGFLVVARAPGDVIAVYGVSGVLGPYTNSLSNKSGTLRLRNRSNAILLEVNYDSEFPWPVAPDGTGHSLVLARPSMGEDHAAAWAPSDRMGGSPGGVDGVLVELNRSVIINEFLAHTDLPELDYVELFNRSRNSVDLSGCWLSDSPTTNKFRIPDGTIIGPTGFVAFTEAQLGFSLNAEGETIYLINSNLTRVIDAIDFEGQENGVATGRFPDGAPSFSRLAGKTPGAPNAALRQEALVINEIMYNPITLSDDEEFVEIYNRGGSPVNLTGWRLNKAIDFTFPTNATIPAGGYIAVAKNVTMLRSNHANLNITNSFGDYTGTLANSGERLTLDKPDTIVSTNLLGVVTTNLIHIIVDEVTYGTGGRWGNWSDGGGSSLELLDPNSDNRLPSNWGDSDETSKSAWTTVSVNGMLDNAAGSSGLWNALQFWLYEAGECLVDNLSVTITGIPGNLVANNGFESGLTGWELQGNHRYSYLENVGDSGTKSLHVVAQDRGDTGANRIHKVLTFGYNTNVTGSISARVKWLRGRPEMLFRLRGNPLEIPAVMAVPKNLGSPAARNSRYATNAGPAMTEVVHAPVLPAANEPIVVSARVHDADGVASVQLTWRVDPFGAPTTVTMLDNGTGGDALARDGVYSATIAGQPDNTMLAFYISATDSNALVRTTKFPVDAPSREALVHVGDLQPVSSYGSYRFWMTDQTLSDWITADKISSEIFKGTFVYGNYRVIYDAGSHYAGSPAHSKLYDSPMGTNCDYQLLLKADDALLDETSLRIQEPGLFGADRTLQNESTGYWLVNQMGVPALNRRPVLMFVNGLRRGLIYEDTQRQNSSFLAQWYPDADADTSDLYRIGYWYEFGDDPLAQRSNNEPSLMPFLTTGGVKKLARYRQTFQKRAVKESVHNYTNLFHLVDILNTTNTGEAYASLVFPHLDVWDFARAFAAERVLNNTDLYGARRIDGTDSKAGAQNSFLGKPGGDKWKFLIWDIDAAYLGTPVDPLFDFTDPPISNLFLHPYVLRTYWQALEDAANGPLKPGNLHPLIDAKYAAYHATGIDASSPEGMKNFLGIRRDYILQLLSENKIPMAYTVNGGANFTNNSSLVTLSGTAPFGARIITINNVAYPLTWTSVSNWTARVPLTAAANLFTVRGYDSKSNLLANSTKFITVYYAGAVAKPENSLVINEIMYRPMVTNAHYVEIYNRSTNTAFGLNGFRLNGLDFNFPSAQIINPLSYLVVVKDTAAFRSAYGYAAEIAGEYRGELDKDGETLTLVKAAANTNLADTVISKVKYEAVAPWPAEPAQTNSGVSLQLVDASQDHARVSNWDAAGGWKFFSYTAQPDGARLALWLDVAGEIFIDDIRLVHGTVPGIGVNRVRNGDFETNLTAAWTFGNSYIGNSSLSSLYAKSGTNSLRLAPTKAGTTSSSTFMYQDISPTPSSSSNFTVSFWYRPTSNSMNLTVRMGGSGAQTGFPTRGTFATPGTNNSVVAAVEPYPLLWINEVQPGNTSTLLDNTGTAQPWIELYNSSTNTIDVSGWSLSKGYTNLNMWIFPAGTILLPGQWRVIFVDGRPQFTTGSVLHTSFRLDGTNGSIVLSRTNQILDYINYTNLGNNVSFGDVPDGQLFTRQLMYYPTPGGTNNPSPAPVVINEWMASNTGTIVNPLTGLLDDWVELYNFSDQAVDLSGYYVTDDQSNKNKWRIPNDPLAIIPPYGFLLIWADEAGSTNTTGSAFHASFKLSKSGEFLGIYSPSQVKVDSYAFGPQTDNVSQGRYPDGNVSIAAVSMPASTPRTNNVTVSNAYAPVLSQPADRTVNEGALITFTNAAVDGDLPAQVLTYSLVNAPEGASISAAGVFTWQTFEQHGPTNMLLTLTVTDNGVPPYTDSKTFQITVNESNTAPVMAGIADQIGYSNTLVSIQTVVSDVDLPSQTITYTVLSGPAGASVDSFGLFTWTPTPAQTPSSNWIVLKATDNSVPALSTTQSFAIVVYEGLACGGVKGDVIPRNNPNGTVGITDWVQVGRFVAGLSEVANSCEFTRADCAPKATCGNGFLTTTDWVQAGRYAAGLDVPAAMMDCPPPSLVGAPAKAKQAKSGTPRGLSFTNASIVRGTTNCLPVVFTSQGDENGFGFSIQFDTNLLTFVSAQRGLDASNAVQFLVNTSSLPFGLVGIAFVLPTDTSLPAGLRTIANLCFRAKAGSDTVLTPLEFTDEPVLREIADPLATVLPTTYEDGQVTLVSDASFVFNALNCLPGGVVQVRMTGPAGTWEVQRSTNLLSWEPVVTITNTTGALEFSDGTATNATQRFYRAVKR